MLVELVSYTPDALNVLLKTKNTRLNYEEEPELWSEEEKLEHLQYMLHTVKSSWEFVDYIFRIRGVSREFTHQVVRTRTGSYAQEALRVVDASNRSFRMPPSAYGNEVAYEVFKKACEDANEYYQDLLEAGIPRQDARGVLPISTLTSIFCKFNLRTLHDTAKLRLCTRTQGQYQWVFRLMRAQVIAVHPWAEEFINVQCVQDGTCAFPNYGPEHCQLYDSRLDQSEVKADLKEAFDHMMMQESAPIAKDGKSHE